ncbi:TraR/DksA C4-type zinc finger protein [Alkalihalobacillus sp. CinArs1]|uniref:TraR/DksA C4-type zinc finger protein n=1 Tax=Alkalihalobacillus sp. CinArs1 TaxID=2995314 RepID=UPI0022DE6791|nr:TraR/DksA C4-type zinc finger protein [Alkalihalobacillus sp. CinArs1]
MLTTNQLRSFKEMIKNRLAEIEEQERTEQDDFGLSQAFVQESTGELSNYDNHPGDTGTELFEREKDLSLDEHLKQEKAELNLALQRINQGKYGVCQECGKEIATERLLAMPTATTCVDHSPSDQTSHNRPAEESANPFGRYDNDNRDANFFDSEDSWQRAASYGTSETPSDFIDPKKDYDNMYVEADEPYGYVEEIETFLTSDIDGKPTGVMPNESHERYEETIDEYEQNMFDGTVEDTDYTGY